MLTSILKPILKPLLNLPLSLPSSANGGVAPQPAAGQQKASRDTPTAQSDGVRFDLSDKALKRASQAAAAQSAPATRVPAQVAPPPASEGAAMPPPFVIAPVAATTGRLTPSSVPASDPTPDIAEKPSARSANVDPIEEERARAWAIRGMDREKPLDLVVTLRVTPKADPGEREVARHVAVEPHMQIAPSKPRGVA